MSFSVAGIDSLYKTLQNGLQGMERAMRDGLKETADAVCGTAKDLCPVDTGRLQRSIGVSELPNGVQIGTTVEYAGYVEFGTRRMAAQPFLYPAVERHRQTAEALLGARLRAELEWRR